MDFPITVESQEDFDGLVKTRLDREKTRQSDLETQIAALTAEKQAFETTNGELETRATTAEQWKTDRETADARTELVATISQETGVPADVLRGADEAELRSHAETLKTLLPKTPVVPKIGDQPDGVPSTEEREAVQQLFNND